VVVVVGTVVVVGAVVPVGVVAVVAVVDVVLHFQFFGGHFVLDGAAV
jgi:hypothetical protein